MKPRSLFPLLVSALLTFQSHAFDLTNTRTEYGAIWVSWDCVLFGAYRFEYGVWDAETMGWMWETFFEIDDVGHVFQYETFFPFDFVETETVLLRVIQTGERYEYK